MDELWFYQTHHEKVAPKKQYGPRKDEVFKGKIKFNYKANNSFLKFKKGSNFLKNLMNFIRDSISCYLVDDTGVTLLNQAVNFYFDETVTIYSEQISNWFRNHVKDLFLKADQVPW